MNVPICKFFLGGAAYLLGINSLKRHFWVRDMQKFIAFVVQGIKKELGVIVWNTDSGPRLGVNLCSAAC